MTNIFASLPAAADCFPELFKNDDIRITVCFEDTIDTRYNTAYTRLTDEKYTLRIHKDKSTDIEILCYGEKSAFYALADIRSRLEDDSLNEGVYDCAPAFKVRGYIEGFYGNPWTHEQRIDMIRTMARHRMNTVYYAPKDDVYHRAQWHTLYPHTELQRIKSLVEEAGRFFIDFYWCIAPGLSICYSSASYFQKLIDKTRQLYQIGVRNFGLLLDDISEELRFPEDRAAFGETVNAHIDLVCRYYAALRELDPCIRLTVCPTLYHGKGNEYYIAKLGQNIPAEVKIYWTGRDICSRELTCTEAIRFIENTRHRPLYWDNYPVNDEAMYNEMHLGPLIGREQDLAKYSEGLISNCMEYAECSKIPLITVADYLWDPHAYDAEHSWRFAIRETVGNEMADAFLVFADHLRTSCLMDDNSLLLQNLFFEAAKKLAAGKADEAAAVFNDYFTKTDQCLRFLSSDLPICRELRKWTDKYCKAVAILKELAQFMIDGSPQASAPDIRKRTDAYNADPTVLINDSLFREVMLRRFDYY